MVSLTLRQFLGEVINLWLGGRIMNTKLFGLIACIMLVVNTTAWAGTCTTSTFNTYFASGFSCTVGDVEFSNFTSYADTVTGGATPAPSSSITVTPSGSDLTSLNLTLTFPTSSVYAGNDQTSTLSFDYVVTPLSGYAITGSPYYYYYDYTGAGTVISNGVVFPGTPTTSPIAVDDNIEVLGGDPGTATLTSYEDSWVLGTSVTPVPATLPLFGSGLAVMGLLGWRRKRKNVAALAAT